MMRFIYCAFLIYSLQVFGQTDLVVASSQEVPSTTEMRAEALRNFNQRVAKDPFFKDINKPENSQWRQRAIELEQRKVQKKYDVINPKVTEANEAISAAWNMYHNLGGFQAPLEPTFNCNGVELSPRACAKSALKRAADKVQKILKGPDALDLALSDDFKKLRKRQTHLLNYAVIEDTFDQCVKDKDAKRELHLRILNSAGDIENSKLVIECRTLSGLQQFDSLEDFSSKMMNIAKYSGRDMNLAMQRDLLEQSIKNSARAYANFKYSYSKGQNIDANTLINELCNSQKDKCDEKIGKNGKKIRDIISQSVRDELTKLKMNDAPQYTMEETRQFINKKVDKLNYFVAGMNFNTTTNYDGIDSYEQEEGFAREFESYRDAYFEAAGSGPGALMLTQEIGDAIGGIRKQDDADQKGWWIFGSGRFEYERHTKLSSSEEVKNAYDSSLKQVRNQMGLLLRKNNKTNSRRDRLLGKYKDIEDDKYWFKNDKEADRDKRIRKDKAYDSYVDSVEDDIEDLLKTNPLAAAQQLINRPEQAAEYCDRINGINEQDDSDATWDKVFMIGGAVVGVGLLATGIGAAAGAGILASTTAATTATVVGLAAGVAEVGYFSSRAYQANQELKKTRMALLAQSNDIQGGIDDARRSLDAFEEARFNAILSGAFAAGDVFAIAKVAGLARTSKNLKQGAKAANAAGDLTKFKNINSLLSNVKYIEKFDAIKKVFGQDSLNTLLGKMAAMNPTDFKNAKRFIASLDPKLLAKEGAAGFLQAINKSLAKGKKGLSKEAALELMANLKVDGKRLSVVFNPDTKSFSLASDALKQIELATANGDDIVGIVNQFFKNFSGDFKSLFSEAELANLSRAEEVLGKSLSENELIQIHLAHILGKGQLGAEVASAAAKGNYTAQQIAKKARILSSFDSKQRRLLMDSEAYTEVYQKAETEAFKAAYSAGKFEGDDRFISLVIDNKRVFGKVINKLDDGSLLIKRTDFSGREIFKQDMVEVTRNQINNIRAVRRSRTARGSVELLWRVRKAKLKPLLESVKRKLNRGNYEKMMEYLSGLDSRDRDKMISVLMSIDAKDFAANGPLEFITAINKSLARGESGVSRKLADDFFALLDLRPGKRFNVVFDPAKNVFMTAADALKQLDDAAARGEDISELSKSFIRNFNGTDSFLLAEDAFDLVEEGVSVTIKAGTVSKDGIIRVVKDYGDNNLTQINIPLEEFIQMRRKGTPTVEDILYDGAIKLGPLSNIRAGVGTVAQTFRGGSYAEKVAGPEGVKLYRVYDESGARAFGPYWTTTKPTSALQAQLDSVLDPDWGNKATKWIEVTLPPGTKYFDGAVAEQYLLRQAEKFEAAKLNTARKGENDDLISMGEMVSGRSQIYITDDVLKGSNKWKKAVGDLEGSNATQGLLRTDSINEQLNNLNRIATSKNRKIKKWLIEIDDKPMKRTTALEILRNIEPKNMEKDKVETIIKAINKASRSNQLDRGTVQEFIDKLGMRRNIKYDENTNTFMKIPTAKNTPD